MDHQRVAGVVEHNAAAAAGDGGAALGLWGVVVLLTVTCAVTIYRALAARDLASVAFVIVSYGALLLLLRFLRAYELAPAVGRERERIRRRVWALCTLLTVMFAWKVAGVVPSPVVAVGVWAAAALTSASGFVVMFGHQQRGRR